MLHKIEEQLENLPLYKSHDTVPKKRRKKNIVDIVACKYVSVISIFF